MFDGNSCGFELRYVFALSVSVLMQCMTLNIFKDCHSGYSNLKIYSPIKFCCGHILQWYKKLRSFNSHMGYKISRSHSPEEFFMALAIGLLLKSNTVMYDFKLYMSLIAYTHVVATVIDSFHWILLFMLQKQKVNVDGENLPLME